jgi:hypothetical protein
MLTIDSAKIKEALSRTTVPCTITARQIDSIPIRTELPSVSLSGTTPNLSPKNEKNRELYSSLRRQIIDSGTRLLDVDALQRDRDERSGS